MWRALKSVLCALCCVSGALSIVETTGEIIDAVSSGDLSINIPYTIAKVTGSAFFLVLGIWGLSIIRKQGESSS